MFYTYSIKNLENGKFYIGSRTAKCMLNRKPENDLGVKYFSSSKDKELRQAIKDGKVKYTILQEYVDAQVCWRAEQQLIAIYWKLFGKDMSYNHCYSNCKGNKIWSTSGTTHCLSTETKEKIGKANRGRKHSIKQNLEHSKVMKGRKLTNETKCKISETMKNRFKIHTHPTEGKTPWNKGKQMNEDFCKKAKNRQKYKWMTSDNEIKIMDKSHVARFHKDWTLIGPIENK